MPDQLRLPSYLGFVKWEGWLVRTSKSTRRANRRQTDSIE